MFNNILVTGSHRSGTSWVGDVLSKGNNLNILYEPFNVDKIGLHYTPVEYLYEYIGLDQRKKDIYIQYFKKYQNFDLNFLFERFFNSKNFRKIFRALKEEGEKIIKKKYILKDPHALLFSDILADEFNLNVVVLIRHPAAFSESIKSKKWFFNFEHICHQPELFEQLPEDLQMSLDNMLNEKKLQEDIIANGILIWNILHFFIAKYRINYPEWLFVRHEDLSLNPFEEFEKLYMKLNLTFNNKAKNYIKKVSLSDGVSGKSRDAKRNVKKWQKRLSENEIKRIYDGTYNIWNQFYSPKEWE